MSAILTIEHLRFAYRGGPLVCDDVSLSLEDGEIGCLLGPSGCGKTTVLRCISGLEQIQAGRIALNGTWIAEPGQSLPAEQRRVGLVFQDYALFPHLTIADNIGFGLRDLDRTARAVRVGELLDVIQLARMGDRYPHELSGGQKQRVALARALAPRPRLLLLDEPFSNLDVEMREKLGQEVRAILKGLNTSALMVTHDQHEAFAIADKVGVMQAGRIEQWDTAYNLYHRPVSRFVANFVGQGVLIDGRVDAEDKIATELGPLPHCAHCDLTPGQAVQVLLRPDDILHDDASDLAAEVAHKAFRGADILYTLKLASGTRVLSLVPSHHNHALGEKIGIRLEIDHVVAFPTGQEMSSAARMESA
ncbi:MAG: ABC transporter ATP-binding protein [Betaproteobacteria bacterium]|nr:ABC transporter ATP-binding protein [Betaproteobacteria bacterium]